MIRAVWDYRFFILGLVKKDFKTKYMNSLLGSLWAIVNPLAMIIVYTVIFSEIMAAKIPGIDDKLAYSIYLCAGILSWQYFLETTQRMSNIFIEQGNLLTKVSFPRVTLPIYVFASSTVNFLIIFVIFLGFLIITGNFPFGTILYILPLLGILQLLALGLGLIVGVLNVFFRDIGQFIGVVLQFLFWLTPIVYTIEIVPEEIRGFVDYNLIYPIIGAMQNIFLYNEGPEWGSLLPSIILTLFLALIGIKIYKKLSSEMVDEL